jgi:hypothetical protein
MNEDDEPEVELSGEREGAPLDASNVPVIVTVSQVRRGWDCCAKHTHLLQKMQEDAQSLWCLGSCGTGAKQDR